MAAGARGGGASACVRVRFQRHDVLPRAFCFNFLEATGSISFASPFPSSFFSLFVSPLSPLVVCPPYPPSRLPPSPPLLVVPRGSSAKCTTVVFSTVDAAGYISPSSLSYVSPPPVVPPSSALLHPPTPARPSPPRPVSFLSLPFRLSLPHDALSRAATPPPRSKGLNRPVQFPTRSASSPRSRPARRRDIARHPFIFERSRSIEGNRFFFFPSLSLLPLSRRVTNEFTRIRNMTAPPKFDRNVDYLELEGAGGD